MKKIRFTAQILGAGAIALGICSPAHATSTLKQVQVSNGSQVDLLFDSKISKSQIKTEFFNDVIQISLHDVSVYPAKISSVSGGSLTKVFAYQYAPKLVRCRFSVKGKAESYKNKLQLITSAGGGKMLTVRLGDPVEAPAQDRTAAAVQSHSKVDHVVMQAPRAKAKSEIEGGTKINDAEEQALLERVMKSSPAGQAEAKVDEKKEAGHDLPLTRGDRPLTGGKPLPSPMNALGKLALVVGLFSLCALAVKKFWKGRAEASIGGAGWMASIGQFARKNLGPRSKKMIEVISSHHLGPKKSIAVVRVAGRMLVLGITDDSINLITQISGDGEETGDQLEDLNEIGGAELTALLGGKKTVPASNMTPGVLGNSTVGKKMQGAGATSAGPALFSDILRAESNKPAMGTPIANSKLARPQADVRVTGYGMNTGATPVASPARPQTQAQAQMPTSPQRTSVATAANLSGVRAQIRNKLEGLKQI
jgi:flagellar biogenesis protein FliO